MTLGRTPQTILPLTSDLWRSSLTHVGLCHSLTLGQRLGADLNHDSLIIGLNTSFFYRVAIYDPAFFEVCYECVSSQQSAAPTQYRLTFFISYKMSANNEVHPGVQLHYRTQSPGTLLKISLKV